MSILLPLGAALFLISLAVAALAWRKKRAARAWLGLVGRVASVERALNPEGYVLIDGELWPARTRGGAHVARGTQNVRVVGARAHLLEVEPSGAPGDE